MGIQWFLDYLNTSFDRQLSPRITQAYRQEPLVWKAVSTIEHPEDWIAEAGNSLFNWQVSRFALYTLKPALLQEDFRNLDLDIPEEQMQKSERFLETIRVIGLEPNNLSDAVSLAISLRQYLIDQDGWESVEDFLAIGNKGLELWKTAFVVLPALIPSMEDLLLTLIDNLKPELSQDLASLITHCIQTTLMDENERFQLYSTLLNDSQLDFQIDLLEKLESVEQPNFIYQLSQSLSDGAAEDKPENNTSIDINAQRKLALLQKLAGHDEIAVEKLQKAKEDFQILRTGFLRQLALNLEKIDPEEARKNWEEILTIDPDNEAFISEYAEFLISEGDVHQALYLLNTLSDRKASWLYTLRYPEFAAIQSTNGLQIDVEQLSQVISSEKSRFLNQSDHFLAAKTAFEQKHFELAKDFISKALLESPNDLETIELFSQINQRLAALKDAIDGYELLKAIEPNNDDHKKQLTQLYIKALEPQKALETYAELIQLKEQPSREESLFYADLAIDAGHPNRAIPIAREMLADDTFDGEAMVTLAKAYIKNDQVDEARELLSHASALAPERAESWLALSRIWVILGEDDQALNVLQKAQVATPGNAQILTELGKLYLAQGQASEASTVLQQAKQIDPENIEASIALSSAQLKLGHVDEAWRTIEAYENDYSTDAELALVIADALDAKGECQRAITVYKFAWQSLRSNVSLQAYMGSLLRLAEQEETNTQKATQDLRDLLPSLQERNATYESTFEMKLLETDVKAKLGMLEEAYEDYLYLLDLPEAKAPRFYQHLQRQIGLVALDLGFEDISMASLQEAITFNASDLPSRHALSIAYQKSGLVDQAVESAQAALHLAPTDTSNVLWFSKFMQANGRPHDAIQALKDAIFSKPEEQVLHLSLARVYLASNAVDESKITLSKMLETPDISTADYLNVAKLYTRMGEQQLATGILQRAMAENTNINFNESCDITYSLIKLNQATIAENFINSIAQKHGQLSSYALLKSDVLGAKQDYQPALVSLETALSWLEEGKNEIQSTFSPEADSGFLPFNNVSAYLRAAQLKRALADYQAAKDYCQEALVIEPDNSAAQLLSVELALSCQDATLLEKALDKLSDKTVLDINDIEIARILVLDALLDNDITKADLVKEHFLATNDNHPINMAATSLIAEHEGQEHQAYAFLQLIKEGFTAKVEDANIFLSLPQKFNQIWQTLAIALVAHKLKDWEIADQKYCETLKEFTTNPRLNLTFASYLAEKAIAKANAHALLVEKHIPPKTKLDCSDEDLFEEQNRLAKAYLQNDTIKVFDTIGKALFHPQSVDHLDCGELGINQNTVYAILSVCKNPTLISKILAEYPQDHKLHFQYALQLIDKNSNAALDVLSAIPINPSTQALHLAALAFAQKENPQAAEDAINRALSVWHNEPEWLAFRAECQRAQGNYQEASQTLTELLEQEPLRAKFWQALGDVKILEKDLFAAKTNYEKANTLQANTIPVLEALADVNRKLGEKESAINYTKELHQLAPKNLAYLETLAELHLASQDYDQAMAYANQVIDNSLDCERALKVKIETLVARHSFDEAKKLAQDAMLIAKDPISFEIYRIRIEARNNPATGLSMATNLALEHPEYPSVLNLLAQYQLLANQEQNAEKTLIRSLSLDENNAETLLALGALSRLNNKQNAAQSYLKQAIAVDPTLIEAYLELGQSYEDTRQTDEALHIYNKAIEQVSKDPRPYVHAANAYRASRDFRSAELMLQQAAQLAPTDQSIRRQLASIVAQNLVNNLQEAPKRK